MCGNSCILKKYLQLLIVGLSKFSGLLQPADIKGLSVQHIVVFKVYALVLHIVSANLF